MKTVLSMSKERREAAQEIIDSNPDVKQIVTSLKQQIAAFIALVLFFAFLLLLK